MAVQTVSDITILTINLWHQLIYIIESLSYKRETYYRNWLLLLLLLLVSAYLKIKSLCKSLY